MGGDEMQARTPPPDEPAAVGEGGVVEKEVETVRTRQTVAGAPVDAVPASRTGASERSGGYFETLPERLGAFGLVLLTALEGLLAIRFLLRAFGANPSSGFVGFINDVSWPFARPFANIFSNRTWDQGVVEVSTLVAMGVYFLIFAILGMLVTALAPRLSNGTSGAA
jgi:YGGT family